MSGPILTILTPAGAGAIGVVALAGPGAWAIARSVAARPGGKSLPESPAAPTFWFGIAAGDEVIVSTLPYPEGEWVELHGHGGQRVVRLLVERLAAAGASEVPAAAFPRRHAVADPRAWHLLERAPTARVAGILLDQLHGALLRAEATPGADVRLTELAGVGAQLITPWRVVIAGPPNVGKSSLVNALAGYTRSVVAPVAGTTRDVVTTRLAFGGWPVELSDTAGLRAGADELESLGVGRARAALKAAHLVLWILDSSTATPEWPHEELLGDRTRLIANKCDLTDGHDFPDAFMVSALTGDGIPGLAAKIAEWLVPNPPNPGEAVPFILDPANADDTVGDPPR